LLDFRVPLALPVFVEGLRPVELHWQSQWHTEPHNYC